MQTNLKDLLYRIAPPLFVLLSVRMLLWLAAAHMGAANPLDPGMHARWDSGHYLAIANTGYEFFSCSRLPGLNPDWWCGNAGWFPGYPLMIRVVTWTGLESVLAGVLLSELFHLGTLWLVWEKLLGGIWSQRNFLCLLLAGFFPGSIYYHAVFPVSAFTFFATLSLCYLLERRALASGVTGALASFSYSTGFLMAPVALLHAVAAAYRKHPIGAWRVGMVASALALTGFFSVLALHRFELGEWFAFFKVQAKYGHGLHNPLVTLLNNVNPLGVMPCAWTLDVVPALQSVFIAALVASVSIAMIKQWKDLTRQDVLLGIFMFVFWLFPLTMGGGVSIYRAEALLLPVCPLARFLSPRLQAMLTIAAILLAYPMAILFYTSKLI